MQSDHAFTQEEEEEEEGHTHPRSLHGLPLQLRFRINSLFRVSLRSAICAIKETP